MAYGISALIDALDTNPLAEYISSRGRGGDTTIGHLSPGEIVLPRSVQRPGIMALLSKEMRSRGINPASRIVGSRQAQKNPYTGVQEFYDPYNYEDTSSGYAPGEAFPTGGDGENQETQPDVWLPPLETQQVPVWPEAVPAKESHIDWLPPPAQEGPGFFESWLVPPAGPVGQVLGGGTGGRLADILVSSIPVVGPLYGLRGALDYLAGQPGPSGPYREEEYAANAMDAYNEAISDYLEDSEKKDKKTTQDEIDESLARKLEALANLQRANVDYATYAAGPELLMYPWVLPSDEISYGRFPITY